jgi:hypothetical protein
MKLKFIHTLQLFFGFSLLVFAQKSSDIVCKIIDTESKYPVSYATVRFENVQNGVIANEDGAFRLPANFDESTKLVIISSIGFETLRVQISTLKPNIINIIYLKPKIESLSAVLIKGTNKPTQSLLPENIIKEAIKRIPVNYPTAPHSYIAYYRDYQLVNNNYYNLNESILENYDAGFLTRKYGGNQNVTALYSYELNKGFNVDSLLLQSIYNQSKVINKDESAKFNRTLQNELEILNGHNPIRNYNIPSFSFVDVFQTDFVDNHDFKLNEIKYIDGTPLFAISFVSKDTEIAKFNAEGHIYISKANYAIYKIEYKMLENEKFNQSRYNRGNSTKFELREKLRTIYEISVEYKPVKDKMYLNYMTFNNRFIVKEPNPFKVSDFEFDPNDRAFYITFNKSVDPKSIERRSRFRILYNGKKLIVNKTELIEPNIVKVNVVDWSAGMSNKASKAKSEDFTYKLKKIKDIFGVTINKANKLLGYQFREFFTQEDFENKKPNNELIFVDKVLPMSYTGVNESNIDIKKYWINTPLKETKDKN